MLRDIVVCAECKKHNKPECPRSTYSHYTGEWITDLGAKFCEAGEEMEAPNDNKGT